ncbi:hypothetical protein ACJX0J_037548, partial [Zea mays]
TSRRLRLVTWAEFKEAFRAHHNKNTSGNMFYTQVDVTPEGNIVLMGTFLVAHHPAKVLFDTCASHTFISRTFVVNHDVPIQETNMGVIKIPEKAYSVVVEDNNNNLNIYL